VKLCKGAICLLLGEEGGSRARQGWTYSCFVSDVLQQESSFMYVSYGQLFVLIDCRPYEASVFETTIRIVGGMLAAYELSQDHMYIDRSAYT